MRREPTDLNRVLALLRRTEYDPAATHSLEVLSGGFVWSDEWPEDRDDLFGYSLVLKELTAFRASLIRGKPDKRFARTWRAVQAACPDWPGFRPERSDPSLREELDEANESALADLNRAFAVCERAERMAARHRNPEERQRKWWQVWKRPKSPEASVVPNNRQPPVVVSPYQDSWVRCPHCGRRFSLENADSWTGDRHKTCGQRLVIRRPA